MSRLWLGLAGLNGLISVAAGAFGAHGLKTRVTPDALAIFEVGVRYHMYHALALLALAAIAFHHTTRLIPASAACMLIGILLFSGSLYAMGLSNLSWRWLGPITPVGGAFFLIGWLLLIVAALGTAGSADP